MNNPFQQLRLRDTLEHVKQTVQERQLQLDYTLRPHENHTRFEYNVITEQLVEATYEERNTVIKWEDAVNRNFSVKRSIVKNDNCIYVSALNEENAKKILRREHNIKI